MNTLWTLFLIVVLGGIVIPLLASAWERTVMRKSSAAAKHRLWTATAVGLFVFPLLAFTPPFSPSFSPRTEGSGAPPPVIPDTIVAPQQPEPVSVAITAPPAPLTVDFPKPRPVEIAQPIPKTVVMPEPVVTPEAPEPPVRGLNGQHVTVAIWLAGVGLLTVGWLGTHTRAAAFLLRCQTGQVSSLVDEIRQRFRIRRNIRVVHHEKIPVPLAMGIFRPTVFFPLGATNWPDEKVRVVLLHELAHVARRDLLWQNLVRLACIVYWPLPTVWYLAHRVKTEQELACDDMVLQSGQRSSDYAEVLLGLSKNLSGARIPQAGITMVRRKTVSKRIDAILDVKTRRNPVGRLLGLSLLGGVILSTGFVSLFAPKIPLPTFVFSMNKAEATEESKIEEPKSDKNFRLGEERTIPITGRVLLPDGSPAGETWLTANHVSGWRNLWERLSSDKDGYFKTKSHVGGYFMVLVDSPQKGNENIDRLASSLVATIVSDPPRPGQYDIRMIEGTKLFGKLTYADGSPASGKKVNASVYGFGRNSITTHRENNASSGVTAQITVFTEADENGNYGIQLAPGDYDISQADGFGEDRIRKTVLQDGEKELRMDFTLPPPTRGVILMPDGSPAANLAFRYHLIYGGKNSSSDNPASTDGDGKFEIILSEFANVISVQTQDEKFGIVKYLKGKERLEPQTLTLLPACIGKVRLISEATGKPIAGHPLHANLMLRSEETSAGYGYMATESDSNGLVELKPIFPNGEYKLDFTMSDEIYTYPAMMVSFFPKTPGETVDLGEKRIPGDFKAYEPKPNDAVATITGRITDENGKPVAGAIICGGNESLTLRLDTKTDANGEYRFENWPPTGMAYVGVWCRGKAAQLKTMIVDPKSPPKIDFTLSPAGKPITVKLLGFDGKPVPNFYVTIPDWGPIRYPSSILLWGKSDKPPKTDDNGTFVWNEAPNQEIPLDFNDADWQNSKYMQIRGEKFKPRLEPYEFLVNPKLEISGKVVDAATGKPIPDFKMFWGCRDNPEYAQITWLSDKNSTGKDGVYSISETWPRYRYYVRIDADGYDPAVSRDIDINEGKQQIDFSLNKMSTENAAKLIRGTVLTPDGKPVVGADVAMLTLGRQPPFFENGRIRGGAEPFVIKTDDKGTFQFAEVDFEQERRFPRNFSLGKSYDYILCFVHDSGFRRIKQDEMQEILKTDKPITLEKWGRLEGTLEVNATPGAGETVVFSDFQFLDGDRRDNSNPWAGFQYDGVITDAQGRFVIERIPAGEGTVYRTFSKKRTGWNASAYTSGTPVMIRSGETTKIQIGGGWPAIGKLEFTAPNIDWSYANLHAYPGKEKPDSTQERLKLLDLVPEHLRTVGDDRYAWMREMQKWMEATEDGKNYVRETTRLNDEESRFQKSAQSCLVAGDGTFRLDNMKSGDWLLEVELLAPPSMDRPYDNGKLLAHAQRHFRLLNAVPNGVSEVPFDLGTIRLKDENGAELKKSVVFQIEHWIPSVIEYLKGTDDKIEYRAAGSVVAIDTVNNTAKSIRLPDGSTVLRDLCRSPDGKYVFVTHLLARYHMPATQLQNGWKQTNVISIVDAEKQEYLNTVLLDDRNRGAANPWGVAVSEDGKSLYVALSGTHELMVIDLPGMLEKLKNHDEKSHGVISSDFEFLEGLKKRIPLEGLGPRELTVNGNTVCTRMHFSDSENIVDFSESEPKITEVLFLNKRIDTPESRGEQYFNDATFCTENWLSCASCHPDGRTDGLVWDLLNDGIGNPKKTKNLAGIGSRKIFFAEGTHKTLKDAVLFECKNQFEQTITDEQLKCIVAYLEEMTPRKNPQKRDDWLFSKGQTLFRQLRCHDCHTEWDGGTDSLPHNVWTKKMFDRNSEFVTPPLTEIWNASPYLHDGSIATLDDLFNEQLHGLKNPLTPDELAAMLEYLNHFGERVAPDDISDDPRDNPSGVLTATLPNGGTVTLSSLADPTSTENVTFDDPEQNEKTVLIPAWKPNGVTLPDHSFRRTRYSSTGDTIRLDLKALKGTYFISYFPGLGGGTGSYEACNVYVSDWKEKDEIDFPVLYFPESETKAALPKENVHYLNDEEECLDNLCEGYNAFYCTKPIKNASKNVEFVQSEGESQAWEVYYAFRSGDWGSEKFQPLALDFAVLDREEREIPARTQGTTIMVKEGSFGNSLFLVNQTFFLKDAQAEPVEVRIECKTYYRVDFQNVSLKPGHLTKPTISVKAYPVD